MSTARRYASAVYTTAMWVCLSQASVLSKTAKYIITLTKLKFRLWTVVFVC